MTATIFPQPVAEQPSREPRVRLASFFAGIGGFDLGFENVGVETVWQCEKKEFCLDILGKHFSRLNNSQRAALMTLVTARILRY